jgi:4-amino-4-deoxy-L-arabinose transferase-like glycosyltransferase
MKAKRKKRQKTPSRPQRKTVADLWHEWRWVLVAFAVGCAVMWVAYPNPLMITDTAEFIRSAQSLQHNPYKPIGYSLFMALIHEIAPHTWALLLAQVLVRLVATIAFLSVLRRFWSVSQGVASVLGALCAIEPLNLLADHTLLSDSLFASFTLLTFAALLWYLKQPSGRAALALWVSLALAMLVRHVGLFYFVLVLLTIVALRAQRWVLHAGLISLAFVALVLGIAWRFKVDQGVFALTAFDGWALYGGVAPFMDRSPDYYMRLDPELQSIYKFFDAFPDSIYDSPRSNDWYRWSPHSPAKQYLYRVIESGRVRDYHAAYVETNRVLRRLSRDIVLHRPLAFIFQVYVPNVLRTVWRATVVDVDTRVFNYQGQTHATIRNYYREDSGPWRARITLFGELAHILPYWVTLWWVATLAGAVRAITRHRRRNLVRLVVTDPVVYLASAMIVLSFLVAASHHYNLRYATPNMPLLMTAGLIAIAGWRRKQMSGDASKVKGGKRQGSGGHPKRRRNQDMEE